MQRRIGLAQALINNPELILLDEPTSGLDPIGTSEIKHLIRELREQGKTIVLSGHLLADMQDICDRIAILHRGELKEIGRVSDLLTVQDVTQIKARNLSPAAIDEIRDVIHRHGGDDVTVDHPTTTLEELFLRIVQESEQHPGRRKVAHDMAAAERAGRGRAGRHTIAKLKRHHGVVSVAGAAIEWLAGRRPSRSMKSRLETRPASGGRSIASTFELNHCHSKPYGTARPSVDLVLEFSIRDAPSVGTLEFPACEEHLHRCPLALDRFRFSGRRRLATTPPAPPSRSRARRLIRLKWLFLCERPDRHVQRSARRALDLVQGDQPGLPGVLGRVRGW